MVVNTYVLLRREYRMPRVGVSVSILGMGCPQRTHTQGTDHRMSIVVRECDTATTRKYRAESLIIVLRRAGQDDLEPHVR